MQTETYIIESVGTVIAYRDSLDLAKDFAKHYSERGTMMGVQVWNKPIKGERKYVCTYYDGRIWDQAS